MRSGAQASKINLILRTKEGKKCNVIEQTKCEKRTAIYKCTNAVLIYYIQAYLRGKRLYIWSGLPLWKF